MDRTYWPMNEPMLPGWLSAAGRGRTLDEDRDITIMHFHLSGDYDGNETGSINTETLLL